MTDITDDEIETVAKAIYESDMRSEWPSMGEGEWLLWERMTAVSPQQYEVTDCRRRAEAAITASRAWLAAHGYEVACWCAVRIEQE